MMKNFVILIFLYLVKVIQSEYETIKLKYSDGSYYIPLKLNNNSEDFIFCTNLPMSFFPSYDCGQCKKYYYRIGESYCKRPFAYFTFILEIIFNHSKNRTIS